MKNILLLPQWRRRLSRHRYLALNPHNPFNVCFISTKKEAPKPENIYTIPNMITMSRIVCSPFLGYAVAIDLKGVALSGCIIFAFSDWLDGYLAKRLKQETILGGFLDPVADKFMIGSLTAGLVYQSLMPLPVAMVIVGRDVAIVTMGFVYRYRERPPGAPFFDTTTSATFSIVPSLMSKVNTSVQFLLLIATLSHFTVGLPLLVSIEPLWWITGTTTVLSGVGYLDGSGLKEIVGSKKSTNSF